MAPKKSAQVPPAAAVAPAGPTVAAIPGTMTSQPKAASSKAASASGNADWTQAVNQLLDHYQKKTPQRTKLIDVFLAFLVVLGGVQFVYCVLGGGFVRALLSGKRGGTREETNMWLTCLSLCAAFQCLPFRFLRYCWTIRPDW